MMGEGEAGAKERIPSDPYKAAIKSVKGINSIHRNPFLLEGNSFVGQKRGASMMDELKTEFVHIGDARIAYREHGAGTALILLHGNSQSKKIFERYQTAHFPDFRTFAVDSRGHGESESEDSSYSIEQYSDDIIALCATKGIRTASVIGYSDGGNIGLFLAVKAPDVFKKIVTISPNYLVSGLKQYAIVMIRAVVKIMTTLGTLGINTKKTIMRMELMLRDIGVTDDDLSSIRTSVHILYAQNDLIREEHIERIAALIPNAMLTRVDRCNHLTILDKREAIDSMRRYLLD
jgi:phosphatidylglycerol lysyltransferase